jgi:hypothetical protein
LEPKPVDATGQYRPRSPVSGRLPASCSTTAGTIREENIMSSTRDLTFRKTAPRSASLILAASGLLLSSQALAEEVSFQFSQSYPGGGTVTGLIVGEDLDGDGRLYAVAPGVAGFLGIEPASGEVTYASVRIEGLLGQTVTNVFDASVADLEDDSNFFWGFAYNLDGGPIGDDPDEGVSFAPLAPSTSYFAGPLFSGAVDPEPLNTPLVPCGQPDVAPCSGITTLEPVDPFPNFNLLYSATSSDPIVTTELLRYTFEQDGFDGGASIRGTISGRDLDGDGRIYSASPVAAADTGGPTGDEVVFAQVEIIGVEPEPIRNVQDLIKDPIDSLAAFFFFASVNVAGSELGDEPGEGLSIAPFSPSTSVVIGDGASPIFFPFFLEEPLTSCGDDELACGALVTLVPDSETETGARLTGLQLSSQSVALTPAPLIVDGDFSGHWLNKTPQGEGLTVQVLDTGDVIVYWLTYDAAGDQRWLFGIGRREGSKVIVDDLQVTGGGAFATPVETDVELTTVGELTIEFEDCDNAQMNYVVDGEAGTLEIGRLTGLKSLECVR